MKLVDPSDPDLIAIEEHVNGQMASARPLMQNAAGNAAVQNMLQYAAQAICPNRRLTFNLVKHPVSRMVGVQCFEIEPHMSQENPYLTQRAVDNLNWMLAGLVQAKLDSYLGLRPLWLDPHSPTSRVTRNESIQSAFCKAGYKQRSLFACRDSRTRPR